MKMAKMAAEDAEKWARAEMFFGEGAGTRRKLLWAEIDQKLAFVPGYEEVFNKVYDKQDMAAYAIAATKERKKIDRAAKLGKNTRALVRGDFRNFSTGVAVLVVAAGIAHETGIDKDLMVAGKKYHRKLKAKMAARKLKRKFK